MKNKLKIVIDTNVLFISVSRKSKTHWIFEKLLNKEYDLCITNDILTEYEEIMTKTLPLPLKDYVINILLLSNNVIRIIPYFNWNLIENDPDDNKFVDCAVASNADFIITNDKHFDILNNIKFPKINILTSNQFKEPFE